MLQGWQFSRINGTFTSTLYLCLTLNLCLYVRCPRFTMHQQRHRSNPDLEYLKSMEQRPHLCVRRENELSNLPQSVLHAGLDQLTPNRLRMRPHSSVVHESGKSQPQTSKSHLRAKSAHPRLVHSVTPVHTNASTIQLQV